MIENNRQTQFISVFEGTQSLSAGYLTRNQALEHMIRDNISRDKENLNLSHIVFEIQTDSQNPDYVNLDYLPTLIFEYKTLKKLVARENEIQTLPHQIENLFNLDELDLSNNLMTVLPKEIGELSNLKYLNLSGNQLAALPSEIKKLTGLISLDISNNQFALSPKEIGELIGLEFLKV